jgi:hypothetical protein
MTGKVCILLELFHGDGGNSRGLYWAGRSNQINPDWRGVPVTFDPMKARPLPLGMRDVADALAAALNKILKPDVDGVTDVWRAVEHGFAS